MGGLSSVPFDTRVLEPLSIMNEISDDDEYWDLLFLRTVVQENKDVQPCLAAVNRDHPHRLRQIIRLGLVRLNDLVHKCDLSIVENDEEVRSSMVTILIFIQAALVEIHKRQEWKEFQEDYYDDCGIVVNNLATTLVRMLHLQHATLMHGQHHWCSALDDDGRHDGLRLVVVEILAFLKSVGTEFIEFPRALFAASTINALRFYYRPTSGMVLVNKQRRARLLQISLILMLLLDITVNEMQITRDDYPEIFRAATASLNRKRGMLDSETFMTPLLALYLKSVDDEVLKMSNVCLIENILQILSVSKGTVISYCLLFILARLLEIPEVLELVNSPCPVYENDATALSGPLASAVLEIAILAAQDFPKNVWIVSVIGGLLVRGKSLSLDESTSFLNFVKENSPAPGVQDIIQWAMRQELKTGMKNKEILSHDHLLEVDSDEPPKIRTELDTVHNEIEKIGSYCVFEYFEKHLGTQLKERGSDIFVNSDQ